MQSLWQWFVLPGNQQILLAAIIALAIGLIIGWGIHRNKGLRLKKAIPDKGDKSFFKGIQYILSNDHDQAIEEFTKSVQVNSDTIETYVALGNLYRSKGDIDRAIRIRQNIILRPTIDKQIALQGVLRKSESFFFKHFLQYFTQRIWCSMSSYTFFDCEKRI